MHIGKPERVIVVEPLEFPAGIPQRVEPEQEPTFMPEPEKTPIQVP